MTWRLYRLLWLPPHSPTGKQGPTTPCRSLPCRRRTGASSSSVYRNARDGPALQARYPQIRCYTGYGIGDAEHSKLKLDITPQGVHGMVMSPQRTYFIDPMVWGNSEYCIVYDKRDYTNSEKTSSWSCEVHTPDADPPVSGNAPTPPHRSATEASTVQLRRYRLAVACTGEYSQFHGGTVPLALAAVNTAIPGQRGIRKRLCREHAVGRK